MIMKDIQSLNGNWDGCYWIPGDQGISFQGSVPGCAHTDLLAAGLIPDPYFNKQSQDCQFIETATFEYKKTFTFNGDTEKVHLHFQRLDTFCDIWLNDVHLGFCDNMFLEWDFAVGGILKTGENDIKVRFYPPAEQVRDYPEYEASFTTERIHIRRMQCTFGWDWVERFVTMGIEGDVTLCREEATELADVYVATTALDSYGAELELWAEFTRASGDMYLAWSVLSPDGNVIWEQKRHIAGNAIRQKVSVPDPQLWWPNGYGSHPLYTLHIEIRTEDDRPYATKDVRFGIRTIRVLELDDKEGSANWLISKELQKVEHIAESDKNETYTGFQVLVNGQPVFCQGANWVPCEPFPSAVTKKRLSDLLTLAVKAHVNMLRVWGGGLIESDDFYDLCDELGILVTQDFLMACGQYPEEKHEFLATLHKEALTAVRRIRNHPSLAWWTGDNENSADGDLMMKEYRGRRAAHLAAEPAITAHDPYRRFMPSTPFGGTPYKSMTSGTGHGTMHVFWMFNWFRNGDMTDYHEIMDTRLARFNNEVPVFGAPAMSSVRRFLGEEYLYDDDHMEFHTKNNPVGILKEFTIYDSHKAFSEKLLGDFTDDDDKMLKMRYIQYEWVRYMLELYRRNRAYTGGIIFWMYDDCWPSDSWSLVDYYANPKAGWYAMKNVCRTTAGTICKKTDGYAVCVMNEKTEESSGKIRLTLWNVRGALPEKEMETSFRLPSGQVQELCVADWDLPDEEHVLVLDVYPEGEDMQRSVYFPNRVKDLHLQKDRKAEVRILKRDDHSLTVRAENYVHAVNLDGDYVFDDNFFTMLPGEERTIRFEKTAMAADDEIRLYSL